MDFLESLPSNYCRICFKDKKRHLKPMSEEVRENFYAITNVQLIKSEVHSNLICTNCNTKISNTRNFREELISNEERLMNSLSKTPNFTFVDPQLCDVIKVESVSSVLKISDVRTIEVAKTPVEDDKSNSDEEKKPEKSDPDKKPEDDGKVICPHCHNSFLQCYIQQHIERVHLRVKNLTCDRCGRKFYKYASLANHLKFHVEMQPFPCPKKCGKNFYNQMTLRVHIKHVHSKESANYICELCAKAFKEKCFLKEHILVFHEGFRFECTFPNCNLKYTYRSGLQKHIDSTHESKLEPCDICGVKYQSGLQLSNHKRLKHRTKKHACSFCDKKYATLAMKKIHEKIHLNQKDHFCQYCNARYHERKFLLRHIKVKHRKSRLYCEAEGCKSVLCSRDNYRAHVRRVHKALPTKEFDELMVAVSLQKPIYLEDAQW